MNPRVFTRDEIRQHFLDHVSALVKFYSENSDIETTNKKLEGLAASILNTIDKGTDELPAFILAPYPHPDDYSFSIENNKNYYPENIDSDVEADISGNLYNLFIENQEIL